MCGAGYVLSFSCLFANKTTFQCQLDHVFDGNLLLDLLRIWYTLKSVANCPSGKRGPGRWEWKASVLHEVLHWFCHPLTHTQTHTHTWYCDWVTRYCHLRLAVSRAISSSISFFPAQSLLMFAHNLRLICLGLGLASSQCHFKCSPIARKCSINQVGNVMSGR